MFEFNNKDTRTSYWSCSGIFIVKFEHILHLVLVFLFLTLSRHQNNAISVVLVSLLLNLNVFNTLFWCFYCSNMYFPVGMLIFRILYNIPLPRMLNNYSNITTISLSLQFLYINSCFTIKASLGRITPPKLTGSLLFSKFIEVFFFIGIHSMHD